MRIFILLFLGITLCFVTCKPTTETKSVKSGITKESKEYTSKYICPMYCQGSGADKMGNCPVCEMDYELNENFK